MPISSDLFSVRKEQIQTVGGVIIEDKVALLREDTNQVLSVMGKGYHPVQNGLLFDLVSRASEIAGMGAPVFRSHRDGARVSFQVEIPTWDFNGDKVSRQMTIINSFDGTSQVCLGLLGNRFFCDNQWWSAAKSKTLTRFKHTVSAQTKAVDFAESLVEGVNIDIKLQKEFERLMSVPAPEIEQLAKAVFGFDSDEMRKKSKQLENKTLVLAGCFEQEVAITKQRTAWESFNAVTRYTTHVASEDKDVLDYAMFATGKSQVENATKFCLPYHSWFLFSPIRKCVSGFFCKK